MTNDRQHRLARLAGARLYAIIDTGLVTAARAVPVLEALLDGGAGVVQLRAKDRTPADVARLARLLLPACRRAGVPFLVNDHPDVAAAVGADGVHIGQGDGSLQAARRVVGPDRLVGRSTHCLSQACAAAAEGFDYIGFGPLYATATKPDGAAIGLAEIAEVHRRVALPVFCIGGINPQTLPDVVAAGARRVVIVSALLTADDPAAAARRALALLPANRGQ